MSLPQYVSGFAYLVNGVKAYFVANGYSARVCTGISAYWEQWNQGQAARIASCSSQASSTVRRCTARVPTARCCRR